MKQLAYCAAAFLLLTHCDKEKNVEDVLMNYKFSTKSVQADGQSTVSISVELAGNPSSDRRSVLFSATGGIFTTTATNKVAAKAEFENGKLVAKAVWRAPLQPGTFTINVQPEFDSPQKEFVLSDSIVAGASEAASIRAETSSFGIGANFVNEVLITGHLRNATGKSVSRGVNVLFQDTLLSGGAANGRFRNMQATTSDSSKVIAFYSANSHPVGTTIRVRLTVVDASGQKSHTDAVLLTVNQ